MVSCCDVVQIGERHGGDYKSDLHKTNTPSHPAGAVPLDAPLNLPTKFPHVGTVNSSQARKEALSIKSTNCILSLMSCQNRSAVHRSFHTVRI